MYAVHCHVQLQLMHGKNDSDHENIISDSIYIFTPVLVKNKALEL